jgi:hypothetical protein
MLDTARRGSSDSAEQANLLLDYFSYQQIIKGGRTRKKN